MLWPNNKKLKKGEYTILEPLGEGRFGITYKVKNRQGNLFVIKVPRLSGMANEDARQMEKIIQESNKLAQFNHPNIVKFKETFQEEGICCVVMEFINGTTLDKEPEKLSEELALEYIKQVGQALMVVHDRGLLHRDIRPGNIIIRAGKPEAVLIDFGLALDFNAIRTSTRPEEMTVGYAPIESYKNQLQRDTYTDIYSLGATLYFLLTHKIPTAAEERERESGKGLINPKEYNPSISDTTNAAILSAMEFESHKRPKSIQEWFLQLGLSVSSTEGGSASSPKKWNLSHNWITAIGTLLAGLAAFLGILGVGKLIELKLVPQPSPSIAPQQSPLSKP